MYVVNGCVNIQIHIIPSAALTVLNGCMNMQISAAAIADLGSGVPTAAMADLGGGAPTAAAAPLGPRRRLL